MADTNAADRAVALAQRVEATLQAEEDAITGVHALLLSMLDAVRSADHGRLAEQASEMGGAVRKTTELKESRTRQLGLLARSMGRSGSSLDDAVAMLHESEETAGVARRLEALRAAIRERAVDAARVAEAFAFALKTAYRVNRDLVTLLHGLTQPAPSRTYDARGRTASSVRGRSILNQVG